MSKIKVNSIISKNGKLDSKSNVYGIKNENKIIFKDSDNSFMKIEMFSDKITLIRDNDIIFLDLRFVKNKTIVSKCKIKMSNSYFIIKIKTIELSIIDKGFKVIYDLCFDKENKDTFTYSLEWSDEREFKNKN